MDHADLLTLFIHLAEIPANPKIFFEQLGTEMKPLAETATYRVVRSQYNIWTKNIYGGKKYSVPVQGFSNFIPRQVATKPKFLHSQYREELVEHF